MSVRERVWTTRRGEQKRAWIVDYSVHGSRHIKTFKRQKDAKEHLAKVTVDIGKGIHVAPSKSILVREAGNLWITAGESIPLERATLDTYRQHLNLHIVPFLGNLKLSDLTTATIRNFEDKLRAGKRSPTMGKRVLISLGSMLADAQERGLVAQNVVRSLRSNRRRKKPGEERRDTKLKVGVDIPAPDEIEGIICHLKGRWRPLLLTAIFTGLRASELRGLRWEDVDLKKEELHVHQRADRYNVMGRPKSAAGSRIVPFPPQLTSVLREWKLQCPRGGLGLVFPNGNGNVENHSNILNRGFFPAQIAAGVMVNEKPKYTGLHALRHFYASWCINRKKDGGLELPLKLVQERMGHSTVVLTSDRYGHLFPRGDDRPELAGATSRYLGDATQTRHTG